MVSGHGADFFLLPSELPRPTIAASKHLHLTAWSFFTDPPRAAVREAARLAQQAGATLSFDPSSFQMIDELGVDTFLSATQDLGIDLFLPNKEEGAVLTGRDDPVDIARELDELYPTLRWFLFDGLRHYCVPLTIFGPQRVAVYFGNMYVVFNSTEHIRELTRHFDNLIRAAMVQPPDVGTFLEGLLPEVGRADPAESG